MSAAAAVLLGISVAVQLVCCAGNLLVRDAADRLHLVGPLSVLVTLCVVTAVIAGSGSRTHVAKVVVTGIFLAASSPFVSRATGRALRIRAKGRLGVEENEVEEEEEDGG